MDEEINYLNAVLREIDLALSKGMIGLAFEVLEEWKIHEARQNREQISS